MLSQATVKFVFMCLVNFAGLGGGLCFAPFLMCSLYFYDQTVNRNHIFHFFNVSKAQKTAWNGCSVNIYSNMDCLTYCKHSPLTKHWPFFRNQP